jgi:hypothetical protein
VIGGASGVMAGIIGDQCRITPFEETFSAHKPIPAELYRLVETLTA